MKNSVFLLFSAVLLLPFFLKGEPADYGKILAKAKEGKVTHQEMLDAQKKCYKEYITYFRKKYASCTAAQEKRNVFLNRFAKEDKKLAPMIAKFNSGLIRNAIDKQIFSEVYKKFSANKDFMTIDRELWEQKTSAAYASVSSQLSNDKKDLEKAYTDTLKDLSGWLEKFMVEKMAESAASAKGKGSSVYKAALAEIENYKKNADPKEMVKSRRNITMYSKYLFKAALKKAPELEKIMLEAENLNKQRIKRELELELLHKDAAYARYTASFGLQQPVKGDSMQEIVMKDPVYSGLVKKLGELNKKRQLLSRKFMNRTGEPAIRELAHIIKILRDAGKK